MRVFFSIPALIFGAIFLFIGSIFGLIAFFFYHDNQSFLQGTVSAQGKITACYFSSFDDDSTCQPTVEFKDSSGETIRFRSNFSSTEFHQGDSVEVRYHADKPADARIASFVSLWVLPLVFGLIGVIFVPIGLIALVQPWLWFRRSQTTPVRRSDGPDPYRSSYQDPYQNPYKR